MKSMDILICDIETDGFYEAVTKLHCLVYKEVFTGKTYVATEFPYCPEGVVKVTPEEGLRRLMEADQLVFHNGIAYDIPVLTKLYPWFSVGIHRVFDTLIEAKLRWPRDKLRPGDFAKGQKGGMPAKLYGNHSLEAFGYRLGVMKGEYKDACKALGIDEGDIWKVCRPAMIDYCVQDVVVTEALLHRIRKVEYSEAASRVEHIVQSVMVKVTQAGFPFRVDAAADLYKVICQERDTLGNELRSLFPPWYAPDGKQDYERDAKGEKVLDDKGKTRKIRVPSKVVVKRGRVEGGEKVKVKEMRLDPKTGKLKSYVVTRTVGGVHYPEGAVYTKIKLTEFNPNSRDHIVNRFRAKYGWQPTEFTDDGSACVDDTILAELSATIPEAKPLARYMLLQKRAGQLAEGNEAWLKVTGADGAIHGGYNTLGAVTRRMTHSRPNIAQVPKVGSYFGAECRGLFTAGAGFDLVGIDLSGIELRCLSSYMSPWDGGAYAEAVVNGSSELGTDVHSLNCKALGMDPKELYTVNGKQVKGRDIAKTWIYAALYGAGNAKLAAIMGVTEAEAKRAKARFSKELPALAALTEAVKAKAAATGTLKGLDGGTIWVRSPHSALNSLLQSAGAIVAKHWTVEMFSQFDRRGWTWGTDYVPRAHIHDEWQISATSRLSDELGRVAVSAIATTGVNLRMKCALSGEYKVGRNWRDTH